MSDEMGDGDSDGEFFSRASPPPKIKVTVPKRPEYSPTRDKVTYKYEFDSSEDEVEPAPKVMKKRTPKPKKIDPPKEEEELKPSPYFAALLGQTPPASVAVPPTLSAAPMPVYTAPPANYPAANAAMPSNVPPFMGNMQMPPMNNMGPMQPMNNMGPIPPVGMPCPPINPMGPPMNNMGGMPPNSMGMNMGGPPNLGMRMGGPPNMGMNRPPNMGLNVAGPPNMGINMGMGMNMGSPHMGMSMGGPPNMGMSMGGPPNMGMNMGGHPNMGMNMGGPPNMGMNMGGPPNMGMNMSGPPNMGMNMGGPPNMGMNMGGPPNMGMNMGGPPNMGMGGSSNMFQNLGGPQNVVGRSLPSNMNMQPMNGPLLNASGPPMVGNVNPGMGGNYQNDMGPNTGPNTSVPPFFPNPPPKINNWNAPNATISKPPVLNSPATQASSSSTNSSTAESSTEGAEPIGIKNDGSFLEMFKKMKGEERPAPKEEVKQQPEAVKKTAPKFVPSMVGKRRGGRVLKTGLVEKVKKPEDDESNKPKDAWSLYMAEVKKYRDANCEEELPIGNIMPVAVMAAKQEVQQLSTAPFDPRFPNTNQTKHCYTSFLDYHRCQKARGADYEPCNYFKRVFNSMCPNAWVEKWNDQLEAGTFPGRI